ncbi:hypothetical protein [Acanthopleuribacter pedis]|uniref:Beta-lactamase-related domain-containing protein n=1 Tax=Acanthopleuribacter pedis TaxID=442870 RepID=A0A8J7Q5E6_9BACT|nr:hypothetical protein [Acanthopleuribacter pedis]MBO1319410.1 hypothetical protein [Acanthopleuribacter pedis]
MRRGFLLLAVLICFGCGSGVDDITITIPDVTTPDTTPPGSTRDKITVSELTGSFSPTRMIHNAYFLPVGPEQAAQHALAGRLTVGADTMKRNPGGAANQTFFPGFSVDFFTHNGFLVPVNRGIQQPSNRSFWTILCSPGRVWSEPGDEGRSRAAFPFVLGDHFDNAAHNGVATFVFDDQGVSQLRMQIMQESAAWDMFDGWGQYPMQYTPGDAAGFADARAAFEAERAQRLPVRPIAELGLDAGRLQFFDAGLTANEITFRAIVKDGVIYQDTPETRLGPFPFPEYMRGGAFSVTKSIGAGLSLMFLAQAFGPELLDEKIVDWLPVNAGHDGWAEVTFSDCADMRTGIGDLSPNRNTLDVFADENKSRMGEWSNQLSESGKLTICWNYGNYPWGPGEVTRYNTTHTFVLSAALQRWAAANGIPNGDYHGYIAEHLLARIGVVNAPMMRTVETNGEQGSPILGVGLYPTVHDLAKITEFMQHGGTLDGEPLLHPQTLAEALFLQPDTAYATGNRINGLPELYRHGFWSFPTAGDTCTVQVPYMSGYGGNMVVVAPNGYTGIRFSDSLNYTIEGMVNTLQALEPFPCP